MTFRFDLPEMPTLQTERMVLRPIRRPDDEPGLFDMFSSPEVARFIDTGPFTNMAEVTSLADWMENVFVEKRGLRWVIAFRSAPEDLIGTCGLHNLRAHNNSAEIGYDLAYPHWGQGLMTEALRPMIDFGFGRLGANRLEAGVTVGNDASARVLEKLGFIEEGVTRAGGYWRDEYHDLRMFGLLRTDRARRTL